MSRPWLTVLTCPERLEYLAATLESLRLAGAEALDADRFVFVDGDPGAVAAPGWQVVGVDPQGARLGTKAALLAVMRTAARSGADHLIYTEDDVAYCRNALTAIERIGCPDDLGFVTHCDIKRVGVNAGMTEAPGYDPGSGPGEVGHWGNQCLYIPGRSLEIMLSAPEPEWAADKSSDILLGIMLASPAAPCVSYGAFVPSLAQHVGARSLVMPGIGVHGWGRDANTFPGEEFDALSLDLANNRRSVAVLPRQMSVQDRLRLRFSP